MDASLIRRISGWIFWILPGVISIEAHAMRCQTVQQNGVFNFPSINVPADVQGKTFLSDWVAVYKTAYNNCVTDGSSSTRVDEYILTSSSIVGNVTDNGRGYAIFNTSTPGVGYILEGGPHLSRYPVTAGSTFIANFPLQQSYDFSFRMRLIATGAAVVNPGVMNSFAAFQTIIYECGQGDSCNLLGGPLNVNWTTSSGAVTTRTCSIVNRNLIFSLPSARLADMPDVGATAGSVTQNIGLNCPAGTNLHMVITDQTSPGNRTSTLTLTGDSEAGGVGIEVLHNGKPVLFGPDSASVGTQNQFLVGSNLGGSVSIPLTARYIRTSLTSRAGSVKAFATFTMSYQ
jgi:type 1 fimbria pilin